MSTATTEDKYEWLGMPLKSIAIMLVGVVFLGFYLGVLLFGENSILILDKLQNELSGLNKEKKEIKIANQKLQKYYFDLIQISN